MHGQSVKIVNGIKGLLGRAEAKKSKRIHKVGTEVTSWNPLPAKLRSLAPILEVAMEDFGDRHSHRLTSLFVPAQ